MTWTTLVVALITALMAGTGGGFLVAWRKDARQAPLDKSAAAKAKLEITEMIERMASSAVEKAERRLAEQESRHSTEIQRLTARVGQLETVMRDAGLTVPQWPPATFPGSPVSAG